MLKSEIKAEELEKKAKEEFKKKKFQNAAKYFEEAKEIYEQLNLKGKINFIEKQLAQLKRVIDYENQKGIKKNVETQEPINNNSTQESSVDKRPSSIKIFDDSSEKQKFLQEAEERRIKLQQTVKQREKNFYFETESMTKISEREEHKRREEEEKQEKLKIIEEKNKKQNELKAKANLILEKAKLAVDYKNFDDAKKLYKEAIDLFKDLGWFDQLDVLYNEIKNLEKYKVEFLRNLETDSLKKQKSEEEFKNRIKNILAEKKKEEEKRIAQVKGLTAEIKKLMEQVNMLKDKAEKEEKINLQRAIGRYEYILELYKKVPNDKLDLTNETSQIEQKIMDLKKITNKKA